MKQQLNKLEQNSGDKQLWNQMEETVTEGTIVREKQEENNKMVLIKIAKKNYLTGKRRETL